MSDAIGMLAIAIMVCAVASCTAFTTMNAQNNSAAEIERCEANGGAWIKSWSHYCDYEARTKADT